MHEYSPNLVFVLSFYWKGCITSIWNRNCLVADKVVTKISCETFVFCVDACKLALVQLSQPGFVSATTISSAPNLLALFAVSKNATLRPWKSDRTRIRNGYTRITSIFSQILNYVLIKLVSCFPVSYVFCAFKSIISQLKPLSPLRWVLQAFVISRAYTHM